MLDILLDTFYLDDMGDRSKQRSVGVTLCVGCGNQIYDQYILRVSPDLEWHAACLKCAECSRHLDETSTCFVRNGKTYCKRDYMWLFGIKCSKCNKVISRNDMVMRARENVYHMGCFRCSACCRHLLPGDEFFLRDEVLFCRADHGAVLDLTDSDQSPKLLTHLRPLTADPASARRPPHHRNHVHNASEKTTRVRTVLNEKQLHTLRTCYNANPRPDALMKEQLVEMTGLSPRVIRVWFQNKRCKDKKRSLLLKQNLKGLTGTPLLASSPVPHETNVEVEPMEVHAHQLLWKSLCDFTLQRVHEPPIFQVSLSESGGSSAGSDSMSLHLPDTPSSMVFSPEDT